MTKSIVGAIKRKDVKALAGEILRSEGLDTEADEIEQAGRLTTALIDRTCVAVDAEESEDVDATEVEDTDEPTLDEDEVESNASDKDVYNIGEIKALCKKGDKKSVKKAKKAFEDQFDEDHPNYDELKKIIKKAKKALK